MEKEEFNKLDVKDQVEYINQKMKNKTLTQVCQEIKISRSTLRDRFLKQGYKFDKNINKYILSSESNKKPLEEKKYKSNTNELEKKIQTLELKVEAIESKLNKDVYMDVKKFEGETVSRCYRLYKDVQKEFSEFCKANSNYKVQDILSMALHEYMKNNKR